MKKILPVVMLLALAACSDDNDPVEVTVQLNRAEISYNDENVWDGVASNQPFLVQYMEFSHEGEVGPWGLAWNGFTPARVSETGPQTDWLAHQFQITTGGGMSGTGTPYIVAFWDTQENESTPAAERSCRIQHKAGVNSVPEEFRPISMYVTNTSYVCATVREGNNFAKKFEEGDWLRLNAHGVHADGSVSTTSFLLVDGTDVVEGWTLVNLSSLGTVTELYFTMESSDSGMWGMNTPSYYAMDCLTYRAVMP